jgi:hypothetical protein
MPQIRLPATARASTSPSHHCAQQAAAWQKAGRHVGHHGLAGVAQAGMPATHAGREWHPALVACGEWHSPGVQMVTST